jgi:hypothetical protein
VQSEQLCNYIHYLIKYIIMKAWVKIVDSIHHHHQLISKMRLTCLLYTPWHIFYTSLWFHCGWIEILELCILRRRTTHTHTTLHYIYIYIYMCVCVYIYIKKFTFKAVFLKAHLLLQTEKLCVCIHYLINHMIMKAWVKIIDSILLHHKWISKMRFTCLLYAPWHIFYTSLCRFLWNIWPITWRMLSMTSCFSPYTASSCGHISLMHTLSVH